MSIENKTYLTGSPSEPSRRKSPFSRAMLVSLCLGVVLAGIALLSYETRKARNAHNAANQDVSAQASPSSQEATRPPALASPKARLDSQRQEQQIGKASGATRVALGVANQIIARAKKLERAPRRQTVAPAEAAVEKINSNLKALHQHPPTQPVAPITSADLSAPTAAISVSPSSAQATSTALAPTPPNESEPRWIPPATRRNVAAVSPVNESKKTTGDAAHQGDSSTAVEPNVSAALNPGASKTGSSSSSPQTGETGRNPNGFAGEVRKTEINEGFVEALSKARVESQTKGTEFRTAVEKNGATTTATTTPGFAATRPNGPQDPSLGLKVEISKPDLVYPAEFRGDLRNLPQGMTEEERKRFRFDEELEGPEPKESKQPLLGAPQEAPPQVGAPLAPMPAPLQSFQGLNKASNGAGWPPDTVGDVGPSHYVQAVNTSVGIYNKTGTQLAAFTFDSLWTGAGTGTACDNSHQGDPTVIYSRMNNRWIVADLAFTALTLQDGPYFECIAVSKTSDPVSGGWWLFAYRADDAAHPWLPDYPKMGLWPDGLYMGANMFNCLNPSCSAATYQEARAYAFNISDLVNGAALRSVVADTNSSAFFTIVPSNYRGTSPPAGRENLFVSESGTLFAWEVWKFHVDYSGAGSTFTGPTNVAQTIYTVAPTTVPSPANSLDSLRERVMMQNQYRNVAGVESLWVNHTTGTASASTPVGIQWAQINVTGGTINTTPVQQQIYNNGADGISRWMGSLAVDNQGNMALGYSASSASVNPDIRYAGRLVTDALGTLPQTETTMLPGVTRSTQSGICPNPGGSTCIRWGDYSSMSVDPSDECTFWYTQEYYETLGTNWLTRIGSFKFPTCISMPTVAKVKSFTADGLDDGRVLLRWSSGYEVDNLGYNVHREVNGQRTKINPQTIAGSALVTGAKVALTAGKSYAWGDQLTQAATRYWLEDIDLSGKSTWTGPISLNAKGGKAPSTEQSVLLTRIGMASSQMTLGQGSAPVERKAEIASLSPAAMQLQTDLAGKPAVKLSVAQEGWYRVSQRDLVNAGFSSKVDPRNLQLYVDGRPVPMIVNGEQDGRFDASDSVEFFGIGINSAVTSSHVYWLAAGSQTGTRIKSSRGVGQAPAAKSFQSSVERKDRTLYFSALKNGETENFFGPVIGSAPVDQSLSFTNLSPTPLGSATLEVAVQGVTTTAHQVRIMLNGAALGTISFSGQTRGVQSFAVEQSLLREGVNSLELVSLGGSADISLADSARVAYWHSYQADSNQLQLPAQGGQQLTLSGFTSGDTRVMDVTDANNPQELLAAGSAGKIAPGTFTVNVPGAGQRTLYAFARDQAKTAALKLNTPSNWRQAGRGADFVILTRQELMASLAPLVSLRQKDGLSIAVVDVEDVYDEFSFGNKTPQAIRDFLQFAKSNWSLRPRFVLLAGDASYDSKNYLGYGDADLVPTKLIDTQYMQSASDDWFSDFNDSGSPQMAMGRLPAGNAAQASALVAKITGYESSRVANSILLASDSTDGFDFAAANDLLRPFIPAGTRVTDVRRGSSDDATVKAQLLASINSGAKVVSYNGHGSTNQWRGNILTGDDARSLTNAQNLSVFVLMTCLNGYFDDPVLDSLSESLLRASNGGAVAVWASTAQSDPSAQSAMNQEFFRQLFGATPLRIGEAAMKAKSVVTDTDVRRTWVLFGDPTMRLK